MPNQQDQQAIDGLFDRIEDVARNSQPRDRDAEVQIQQRLQDFPPAPYYMAQTILIQEEALRQAQQRIEQLQSAQRSTGGFLGGLLGGDAEEGRSQRSRGPWDRQPEQLDARRGNGAGFLAGAAQTALGVTGGVLLGSAIAGMLTGGAQAGEHSGFDSPEETDPGSDDFGGGDFDIGGDF